MSNAEQFTGTRAVSEAHAFDTAALPAWLAQHLPGLADDDAAQVTVTIATNADSLGTWLLPAVAGVVWRERLCCRPSSLTKHIPTTCCAVARWWAA